MGLLAGAFPLLGLSFDPGVLRGTDNALDGREEAALGGRCGVTTKSSSNESGKFDWDTGNKNIY